MTFGWRVDDGRRLVVFEFPRQRKLRRRKNVVKSMTPPPLKKVSRSAHVCYSNLEAIVAISVDTDKMATSGAVLEVVSLVKYFIICLFSIHKCLPPLRQLQRRYSLLLSRHLAVDSLE